MNKLQINPVIRGEYKTGRVFISVTPYLSEIELKPNKSLKIINHSPTGFAWGYSGSGPAQLALAVLVILLPKEDALALYQDFKRDIVSGFAQNEDFELSFLTVEKWLQQHEK